MSEQDKSKEKNSSLIRKNKTDDVTPQKIFENAMSSLSEEELSELKKKAAEEAMKLEIERRQKSDKYLMAKEEMRDFSENFDRMSQTKGGKLKSVKIEQEFETATGRAQIKANSACFIATVVYGSVDSQNVVSLREFRDKILLNNEIGFKFVIWYYKNGPILAEIVKTNKKLRLFCKVVLDLLVKLFKFSNFIR